MTFPGLLVRLEVDFDPLELDLGGAMTAMRLAALHAAEYVKTTWIRVAGEIDAHDTGEYVRGIRDHARIQVVSETADPAASDEWEVVVDITNTARHASIVEEGHGAFHLPDRINWSGPRVKMGRNGPYLSIPFRHAAYASPKERENKGYTRQTLRRMMPAEVYAQARGLAYTMRQGVGPVRTGGVGPQATGRWVALDRYRWGGRLRRGDVATGFRQDRNGAHELFEERRGERQVGRDRHGPLVNPAWQTSRFEGMFRAGPKGHTAYMTIRTLTPTSKGWNIPAQLGHFVTRRVVSALGSDEQFGRIVQEALAGAFAGPESTP